MKFERLFEQLKYDEGVVYEIYKDHLGYPTFGVGHLILESEGTAKPELIAIREADRHVRVH